MRLDVETYGRIPVEHRIVIDHWLGDEGIVPDLYPVELTFNESGTVTVKHLIGHDPAGPLYDTVEHVCRQPWPRELVELYAIRDEVDAS